MVKKTCHNEYSLNANNLLHISYSIYQYNLAIHDLLTKSSTHSTSIHLYLNNQTQYGPCRYFFVVANILNLLLFFPCSQYKEYETL